MKNRVKGICIIYIIMLLTMALVFYENAIKPIGSSFDVSEAVAILLAGMFCFSLFLVHEIGKREKIILTLLLFIISLIWCRLQPVFSPIDEGAHLDYIHYITVHNKFPIISSRDLMDSEWLSSISKGNISSCIMYEAVHPWLYYMSMALLCKLMPTSVLQFWACRLFGCFTLVAVFIIALRFIDYLCDKEILRNKKLAIITSFFVFLSPGILTRFCTVSNEPMAVFFTSLFLYKSTKTIIEGLTKRRFFTLSILVIAAAWTKTTTIFIYVLFMLVLLYYKKFKYILISTAIIVMGLSPWLIWNMAHYHHLTGMAEHLAFVIPIVNPFRTRVDVTTRLVQVFTSFIHAEEGYRSQVGVCILHFLCISVWSGLIYFFIKLIDGIKTLHITNFSYTKDERTKIVHIVLFLSIVGNLGILFLATITSKVPVIIGRYLYLSLLSFIFIFEWIFEKIMGQTTQKRRYLPIFIFTVIISVLCIDDVVYRTGSDKLKRITGTVFNMPKYSMQAGLNRGKSDLLVPKSYSDVIGDKIVVNLKNCNKYKELRLAVWSEQFGQDDLKWYSVKNLESSSDFSYEIPVEDFCTDGIYFVHIYGVKNGESDCISTTGVFSLDYSERPTISAAVSEMKDSINVDLKNIVCENPLKLAVWSLENDQDDLRWYDIPESSGGNFSFEVPLLDFNTSGDYALHLWSVEHDNLKTCLMQRIIKNVDCPSIIATISRDENVINVSLKSLDSNSPLKLAVWSLENGQDDLKWYDIPEQSGENFSFEVPLSDFNTSGDYALHLWSYDNGEFDSCLATATINVLK